MSAARSPVWRFFAPVSGGLFLFVLFFAGLRLARPGTVFYYTEGPVLGSLAGLEASGSLSGLYPSEGWSEPPVVLTLYPPVYFMLAAGIDHIAKTSGSFAGLRVVTSGALLAWLALFIALVAKSRAPPFWIAALLAAALLTPGVYTLVGAAQVDLLAVAFTWAGIAAFLDPASGSVRPGVWPLLAAAAAFFLAFLTKQSFVAAPAALTVSLILVRRYRAAMLFSFGLAAAVAVAAVVLNRMTGGGYLFNTLGALGGLAGTGYLVDSLKASRPLQWVPLMAAVYLGCRGSLRRGFAEIYLLVCALLHTFAMSRAGSSANYLLEPTLALLLVAVIRWRGAPDRALPSPNTRMPAVTRGATVWLIGCALAVTAIQAALGEAGSIRTHLASGGAARVSEFEGYPLVDVRFFPAVLERGGRPWLNDPFAFGVMEETGKWDPAPLISDLEAREIPFVISPVDVQTGPAAESVGTRELIHGYFWFSRPIWTALTRSYRPVSGPLSVWLPEDDEGT